MIETSCIIIDFVSTLILKNPMSYSEIIPLRVQTNLTSHHIQNIEWYEIMVKGSALYDVKDGGIFSYTQPILLSYLLTFCQHWLCFVNFQLQDWGFYEWPVEGMYSEKMTIMPIISVNLDFTCTIQSITLISWATLTCETAFRIYTISITITVVNAGYTFINIWR